MTIYLDYNATAPALPQAISSAQHWLSLPANPSSAHSWGRTAKKELETARKIIAEFISAWPNEIIFTASGTEANLTALRGFSEYSLLVSAVEHSSVLSSAQSDDDKIPVDANGIINLAYLDKKLAEIGKKTLVSVMLANNETGVIQPISEISQICKKHGAILHCDAVQALGKIPVDFSLLGADLMSISAHKCGGIVGAAALIVKNNISIKPLLTGGGQELGRRAGTENIAAISAFSAAVASINYQKMQKLRGWLDNMENALQAAGAEIIAKTANRLPNTSSIVMPAIDNQTQLINFDLAGFAVSAGSACSSGRLPVSHVLLAMGMENSTASSAIRISGGWNSSEDDIKNFTKAWIELRARL